MLFLPSQDAWQAIALLAIVTLAASGLARWWPAYRDELTGEAGTRQLSLDGLRGVLCFAVLLHHAACTLQQFQNGGAWTSPASHVYTMFGGTSVCLFFCTTGFLFWGRILQKSGGGKRLIGSISRAAGYCGSCRCTLRPRCRCC